MSIRAMSTLCIVDFSANMCFAIIATFFPAEAEKKGVDKFIIGLIFGIFQGTQFVCSPLFGYYMDKVGVKMLYFLGVGISSVSTFVFGFTTYFSKDTYFILSTFFLRMGQGIGCAAFSTSSYVMIINLYPNRIGTAFGVIQTFAGLGFSLGPALGGFLYVAGGYVTPFITMSVCLFVLFVTSLYTLPRIISEVDGHNSDKRAMIDSDEEGGPAVESSTSMDHDFFNPYQTSPGSLSSDDGPRGKLLLKEAEAVSHFSSDISCPIKDEGHRGRGTGKPFAFLSLFRFHPTSLSLDYLVVVAGTLSVGFVDPTLEPHLREAGLGLTSPMVGALFLALSGTFTVVSLALGPALDHPRLGNAYARRSFLLSACTLSSLALLLSGPSPLLFGFTLQSPVFSRQSWLACVCLSQMILGVAFALQIVVPFTDMMKRVSNNNSDSSDSNDELLNRMDVLKLHALVSGLFTSALALGAFLGPLIGGLLTWYMRYEWASTVLSAFSLIVALVGLTITSYESGSGTFVNTD